MGRPLRGGEDVLIVTVEVYGPEGQGAKEAIAMRLEDLGGVRVVNVREVDDQTRIGGR